MKKKNEQRELKIKKEINLSLEDLEVIEFIFDLGLLIEDTKVFNLYKKSICLGGPFKITKNKLEKSFYNHYKSLKKYPINLTNQIFEKIKTILNTNKDKLKIEFHNDSKKDKINFFFKNKKITIFNKEIYLNYQDFTINSIFYNIYENKIIDPYNGFIHLTEKKIKCIKGSEKTFRKEFNFRFTKIAVYSVLGFDIDREIIYYIKKYFGNKSINKFGKNSKIFVNKIGRNLEFDQNSKLLGKINKKMEFDQNSNFFGIVKNCEFKNSNFLENENNSKFNENSNIMIRKKNNKNNKNINLEYYQNWNFFLKKNSSLILKKLMDFGIFTYIHRGIPSKKLNEFSLNCKFPLIYLCILNLIEKLDIFFEKREELKKLFFLSDQSINDNEYLMKTHSIIYFFLHPIFNKNLKYNEIDFICSKLPINTDLFIYAYQIVKNFSYQKFKNFVSYFFSLKLKYPYNYSLFVFLPILDYYDKENIKKENFLKNLKIIYCFKKNFIIPNENTELKKIKKKEIIIFKKKKENQFRKRLNKNY